jgi:hypothetical protein
MKRIDDRRSLIKEIMIRTNLSVEMKFLFQFRNIDLVKYLERLRTVKNHEVIL